MPTYDDFEWTPPAELASLADDKFPWGYYLESAVHFDAGVVRPADDGDGKDPPFGRLHVVNAVQPHSDPASPESASRIRILDRELSERGLASFRVVGSSFDGDHCEDSRAISGLSDGEARALGMRFGQVAIFAWRGPWWSVLACATVRTKSNRWHWEAK